MQASWSTTACIPSQWWQSLVSWQCTHPFPPSFYHTHRLHRVRTGRGFRSSPLGYRSPPTATQHTTSQLHSLVSRPHNEVRACCCFMEVWACMCVCVCLCVCVPAALSLSHARESAQIGGKLERPNQRTDATACLSGRVWHRSHGCRTLVCLSVCVSAGACVSHTCLPPCYEKAQAVS